jgi:hypothetical protein
MAADSGLRMDAEVDAAYAPKPDPCGPLHNSKVGFYRLTVGFDRPIGTRVAKDNTPRDSSATRATPREETRHAIPVRRTVVGIRTTRHGVPGAAWSARQ